MSDNDEGKGGDKAKAINALLESFTKHACGDTKPSKITISRKGPQTHAQLRGEELPSASTTMKCSFCSRSFAENDRCAEGESGVLICSDCIKVCNKIMDEDAPFKS